ncbi:MAG: DUF1501 domain-containing protein [Planctomycetota bacterium]|nr:DUF1501 domain-containing protein [Planctomycetota bacterium]MDA1214930.1 DUF1501 domain-containing protein [Planctomycetota bacterium]
MNFRSRSPSATSRRDVLRAGLLGLSGLGLGDLLRMRANADSADNSTEPPACILVWLGGGPSHIDTYDLKPNAPSEYRGPYQPIQTAVPGLDVCELMPLHTKMAHRFSLLRSCHHGFSGHWDGAQHVLTGWPAVLTGGGTVTSVYPEVGTVFKKIRPTNAQGIPNYVAVSHRLGSVGPAYLGQACEPFIAPGNPASDDFKVPNLSISADTLSRFEDRRSLRNAFDQLRRDVDSSGMMHAMDSFDREAVQLLTNPNTERAFDLTQADPRRRDRYGRVTAGQSLFLALRLVEMGVEFVTVELAYYREAGVDGGWDDHAGTCNIFDRMNRRLPVYDQALTALIDDIYERGLDKRVLVVVMGEFGRTPQINVKENLPGREHWPSAMSVLFSGGGMNMGQVIGSTDSKAERPKDRALRPVDVLATMYRFLKIDPQHEFHDQLGRPFAILPEGDVIRELI